MRQLRKNQKGSSLVMAIVAVTFVSLLALAVIALTVNNMWMKQSETRSEKNLYHTDSILDKIRAGLENDSEEQSITAYKTSMAQYTESLSAGSESLLDRYRTDFQNNMVKLLSGSGMVAGVTSYQYNDSALQKYLTTEETASFIGHASGNGSLEVEGKQLRLKDVQIKKIEDDYSTLITTDLIVRVPPITSESHSEYLDYALIADNQIQVGEGQGYKVEGGIYAGTVKRDTTNNKTGIIISGGSTLTVSAANIITRGDILINSGCFNVTGTSDETANVWAENIKTSSESPKNIINIDGDCNVANDLQLNGEGDDVTLKGRYYGYNYSDDYSGTGTTTNADYSSAIMINGRSCSLNMLDLNQLILAGHTYISRNAAGETYAGTTKEVANQDIKTGESLTVKSTQLAYYVPQEYVKKSTENLGSVNSKKDTANGKWYFKNVQDDASAVYEFDYKGFDSYLGMGYSVESHLKDIPLQSYYRNDTNIAAEAVTYFYLDFKTESELSDFYRLFREKSKRQDVLGAMEGSFVNDSGILLDDGKAILCMSGNILYKKSVSQTNLQLAGGNDTTEPTSALTEYAKNKSKEYMSRELSLVSDYADAMNSPKYRLSDNSHDALSKSGVQDHTNLFNKLVDDGIISTNTNNKNEVVDVTVEGENKKAIVVITNGDYVLNASSVSGSGGVSQGIIVAKGNVKVQKNFNGLIIAGGDIILSQGASVKAAPELLTRMFIEDKKKGTPLFYNLFSKYLRKSMEETLEKDSSIKDRGTVGYENWKKN